MNAAIRGRLVGRTLAAMGRDRGMNEAGQEG